MICPTLLKNQHHPHPTHRMHVGNCNAVNTGINAFPTPVQNRTARDNRSNCKHNMDFYYLNMMLTNHS